MQDIKGDGQQNGTTRSSRDFLLRKWRRHGAHASPSKQQFDVEMCWEVKHLIWKTLSLVCRQYWTDGQQSVIFLLRYKQASSFNSAYYNLKKNIYIYNIIMVHTRWLLHKNKIYNTEHGEALFTVVIIYLNKLVNVSSCWWQLDIELKWHDN